MLKYNNITPIEIYYRNSLVKAVKGCDGSDVWQYVEPDYSNRYLTFKILSAGTISWKATNTAITETISYSKNNGSTWTNITSSTGGTIINVNAGDKVFFKGNNERYGSINYYNTFSASTAYFTLEGNIMSLISGDSFSEATTLTSDYTFKYLFKNTNVVYAEHLVLPATTLTKACYSNMFENCRSLTAAPELPATTLDNNCYYYMFNGCTSLTKAPSVLPATALTYHCYNYMFNACGSLTTAPTLPAATLADGCYTNMFFDCASLNSITCLATDISANACTTNWLGNVAASGTFRKASSMTGWTNGANGIPNGWTVLNA